MGSSTDPAVSVVGSQRGGPSLAFQPRPSGAFSFHSGDLHPDTRTSTYLAQTEIHTLDHIEGLG